MVINPDPDAVDHCILIRLCSTAQLVDFDTYFTGVVFLIIQVFGNWCSS